MALTLATADLATHLDAMTAREIDELDFGVVVMDRTGHVSAYNRHEAEHTGLAVDDVIGQKFFETVGPCMNNYLVAERYRSGGALDVTLDYVFTIRMEPTPVTLRLLASEESERQYLVVAFP